MTRMRKPDWQTWVLSACGLALALALLPEQSLAQGCSMCATYLSNGADPRAQAFKISIMFLMAMPFVVVATAGGWIVWMYRRSHPRLPVGNPEEEGVS